MQKIPIHQSLKLLVGALHFIRQHLAVILLLGFVSGFGRVVQLGGFGTVPGWLNITMEVLVVGARILLFLYVLGLAQFQRGGQRIINLISQKENWSSYWKTGVSKFKNQWLFIIINCVGFLAVAGILNYLIDLLAYQTCLLLKMKEAGIIYASATEWTILLFFKNISVIPLTLVFETMLLLWLVNRLWRPASPGQRSDFFIS